MHDEVIDMADQRRTGRRRVLKGALLATAALFVAAAPTFADEPAGRTLEWATRVSDDGVVRPDIIASLDDVWISDSQGMTPAGVEWTKVTFVDTRGVEWTKSSLVLPEGGTRLITQATQPDGVELSYTLGVKADGTEFTQANFVNARGDAWVRRQPGRGIRGVEWTRKE
jgi:hypothetical protein